nr:hypothetical protein [Streptomyces sp. GC420]
MLSRNATCPSLLCAYSRCPLASTPPTQRRTQTTPPVPGPVSRTRAIIWSQPAHRSCSAPGKYRRSSSSHQPGASCAGCQGRAVACAPVMAAATETTQLREFSRRD